MSKQLLAGQEKTIKDSLLNFVKSHIPNADLSLIDDIILSYAVAILEDIGDDPNFDVEEMNISTNTGSGSELESNIKLEPSKKNTLSNLESSCFICQEGGQLEIAKAKSKEKFIECTMLRRNICPEDVDSTKNKMEKNNNHNTSEKSYLKHESSEKLLSEEGKSFKKRKDYSRSRTSLRKRYREMSGCEKIFILANISDLTLSGFCEMMSAYFPEFESINHSTVYEWMFELEAHLRNNHPEEKNTLIDLSFPEIVLKPKIRTSSVSEVPDVPKRVHKLSEVSDGSSVDSSCCDFADEVDILQEMFPDVCSMEVKHCLTIACGDIERATQILIDRQESGQCLSPNNSLTLHVNKTTINDAELKNRIIERYSYVDKDAFTKEHRPVAPKVEPKKLVRYRDNKIVSLKGERFTEVKKGEDVDDVSLKKNKKGPVP